MMLQFLLLRLEVMNTLLAKIFLELLYLKERTMLVQQQKALQ